jgi:predicted nucleic acid-binding protein
VFLGLISQEPEKISVSKAVWEEAELGKTVILTSLFTLAEVIRARCEVPIKPLPEAQDSVIVDFLSQKFITRYLVDEHIATYARRLCRAHTVCKKPSDGIHLATALHYNADEMHTWDGSDLLELDGKVQKRNGSFLKISKPAEIVLVPPMPEREAEALELGLGEI